MRAGKAIAAFISYGRISNCGTANYGFTKTEQKKALRICWSLLEYHQIGSSLPFMLHRYVQPQNSPLHSICWNMDSRNEDHIRGRAWEAHMAVLDILCR